MAFSIFGHIFLVQYISGFGPRGTRLLVSGDAQYISEVGAYPSDPPLNQTDDAALGYRDLRDHVQKLWTKQII